MSFKVVIPARYASSRLPGKPLADIAGKPMVVRVAERAAKSDASEILVATDHEEVRAAVERHGYRVAMTRADHASGTDRLAEVAAGQGWSEDVIVVNVQGDEPLIEPALINQVARELERDAEAVVATACQSQCGQGGVRRARPCPLLQSGPDTLAARCLCARPSTTTRGTGRQATYRHLCLPGGLPAPLRCAWALAKRGN